MGKPRDPDRQLLGFLADAPVALGLYDADERLRWSNVAFRDFLAIEAPEQQPTWEAMLRSCHRRHCGVLIETTDIDAWIARVRRKFRQARVRNFESDLVDGRWMWVTETLREDGWLLVAAHDVTPLKAHEATLRQARDQAVVASLTDALTGLHNRRAIFQRLEDLLGAAQELRYPLTLALIDLDHFKQINDRAGHQAGDAVLRHFADVLRGHLRPLDTAGRIGGEEFLLLMPNARAQGAQQALARLRSLSAPGAPLPYTFSAGIAVCAPGDTAESALRRADVALYAAKQAGRDATIVAGDAD